MDLREFKLERYFARYEFNTKYLLSSSDCESCSIQDIFALEPEASDEFMDFRLGYVDSAGGPELREAIAGIYSKVSPENVRVYSGAEEAIFLFMSATLSPGDEVIVHMPSYQALSEVPRALGCKVVPWIAREKDDWALDLEELKKLLTPKTKVVAVNFPHNPTGYLMPHDRFRELCSLAGERGFHLFSDEVYRESEYSPGDRLPAACELTKKGISLGVLSKSYGLAGLRIGWLVTHDQTVQKMMDQFRDYTTICSSGPSEFLAAIALRNREELVSRIGEIVQANLAILDRFFSRHGDRFSWVRPKAGPIGFPRLLRDHGKPFCHHAVTDAGILLLPGTVFGYEFENHFRIGFGRRNMPEALAALEKFLG